MKSRDELTCLSRGTGSLVESSCSPWRKVENLNVVRERYSTRSISVLTAATQSYSLVLETSYTKQVLCLLKNM